MKVISNKTRFSFFFVFFAQFLKTVLRESYHLFVITQLDFEKVNVMYWQMSVFLINLLPTTYKIIRIVAPDH